MRRARRSRSRASSAWLFALSSLLAGAAEAAEPPKRELPDYDGRGGEPKTAGDHAALALRILLSPLYLVSEYLVRRPIGTLIAGAERAGLPGLLYDFFTFGPDHGAGIIPVAFVDFGFRPSVGLNIFWNNAFVEGHDLRLRGTIGGSDWLAGAFADRVHLSRDPYDLASLQASAVSRPDYAFFGLGPRSRQNDRVRYGADTLEADAVVDHRLSRLGSFHVKAGLRSNDFRRGGLGGATVLDDAIASGATPAPPGYARGYTMAFGSLAGALDTRQPSPASGSGVRLEIDGAYAIGVREKGSWVSYGGAAGGFLDLNDRRRVVSLSIMARFADPLGSATIPFTELVTLGGTSPMRGFYQGRLLDRSAAVAELAYRWPVWIWLDGAMRFEVGNVFGAGLRDFDPGLLRFSGSIGLENSSSPDTSFQMLVGFASETFESGAKIDAFRFMLGTTRGF
jgi:hypothetical protein